MPTKYDAQARAESSMYQQGAGWVVSRWSETYELNMLTNEMPHASARQMLTDWRAHRAEELRGA